MYLTRHFLLLAFLLLTLPGCITVRRGLVPEPEASPAPASHQYSVNVDIEGYAEKSTIERAFRDSGLFSQILFNQPTATTDFQAKVVFWKKMITKHDVAQALVVVTYTLVPIFEDHENFSLQLIIRRQNNEIATAAALHEETRKWYHLFLLATPFLGEDEITRSDKALYNLIRAALAQERLDPNPESPPGFY